MVDALAHPGFFMAFGTLASHQELAIVRLKAHHWQAGKWVESQAYPAKASQPRGWV
jgi:hypothetical protein